MPIKSLESYLFERALVGSAPIESLNGITLGIDVDHYVSRLLTNKREQYLDAIGGFPTSLKMYIESDLQVFQENNVVPVFVFSGSPVANQLHHQSHLSVDASAGVGQAPAGQRTVYEAIIAQRNKLWAHWSNQLNNTKSTYIDQPLSPGESFRHNVPLNFRRFQADLIQYFISKGINYMVAPYSSWIQLAYLLEDGYVDGIYGPTDLLLVESVPKFILGMEFPNREFRFVDRGRILTEFKLSFEDFLDINMAVGNDLQPFTLPPLQVYPQQQVFEIALDMSVNGGTNFYTYLLTNPMQLDSTKLLSYYQKGVAALKYMPVLKTNGRVELYGYDETELHNKEQDENVEVPNDIHDFIQQRLPHEYNFYRSIGLISSKLLDIVSTGVYFEYPPLDGGSSDSYRNLVKKSVEQFKNKEINLLTQPINRYYQIKPIKHVKWFSPGDDITLVNRVTPSIYDRVKHIYVRTDDKTRAFSMLEFINVLKDSKDMAKDFTVSSKKPGPIIGELTAPFDLLATNFLRLLSLLGFFKYESTLKPTKYGEALMKFNELNLELEFYEPFLVLLMFFKLGVLKLGEETQPPTQSALSQVTLRSYPKESQCILCLTRVLTLFKLRQKPANYYGPIDKKTLTFREHLDYVKQNISELFEAVLVSSLAAGEFNRIQLDNAEWQQKIVGNAPFKVSTPNTVMAMMWEFYLQKWLHNGQDKQDALALVSNSFSAYKHVPNLEEEMKRALKYLENVKSLLGVMHALDLIQESEYELFNDAAAFANKAME
ncbi:AER414Wp [Eremothecium gossypii ATCC 10895]|uniref:AER414Wp n=1 Tax=Eremothecium gossypii (strain ATCC 10895 / CBS 109.51 / FGSC 9923 / NRRL Y-1056) TaxID=284811 RepID=Q755V4_EREGS|nr:AER414Wp [Eremothecium gossypii ATCC 10895]AAS53093.2 AER414Wp [Eremothecium gossypii ATCC 10895]AEY97402.1 FAER414Wp [Eremothecium gossypii FDAG1]